MHTLSHTHTHAHTVTPAIILNSRVVWLHEEPIACGSPLAEGVACYGMQPTRCNLLYIVMLFGANTNPSQPPSTSTHSHPPSSTHSHLPPITDSLPAIILLLTTALPPCCPPTEIDGAPQSSDFLDLLDNGKDSACSSKQWMPTPDRPRKFPRKLY